MEEIKSRTKELYYLVEICKKIYQPNKYPSTIRALYGKKLLEKTILHAISFTRLWPVLEKDKYLDTSTLASIARNIIELHNIFQYVCERGISEDEFNFRINLMSLHQGKGVIEILQKLGFPEDDEIIVLHKSLTCFQAIANLEANEIFCSLEPKQQKDILKSKKAYLKHRITNKTSPVTPDIESGIYNLLSNSLHSFPLGISNYNGGSKIYHLSSYNMMFLSMEVTILYLTSILSQYLRLRTTLSKLLTAENKRFIKEVNNNEYLYKWIDSRIDLADKNRFFSLKL